VILPERFDMLRYRALVKPRAAVALVVAVGLTLALALRAPPAALDIQRSYDGAAAFDRGMQGFNRAFRQLEQDSRQVQAGTLSERELDARGRSVYAPALQRVQADLAQAWLPPNDTRQGYLDEVRHFNRLMVEALSMASADAPGTDGHVAPADPARMAVLEAEIQKSSRRMATLAQQVKRLNP
jgi:hypothetical protein